MAGTEVDPRLNKKEGRKRGESKQTRASLCYEMETFPLNVDVCMSTCTYVVRLGSDIVQGHRGVKLDLWRRRQRAEKEEGETTHTAKRQTIGDAAHTFKDRRHMKREQRAHPEVLPMRSKKYVFCHICSYIKLVYCQFPHLKTLPMGERVDSCEKWREIMSELERWETRVAVCVERGGK